MLAVLAGAIGCQKSTATAADGGTVEVAVAEPPDLRGEAGVPDLPPPPPLVPADPNIPVHEALVGDAPIPPDEAAPTPPPAPATEQPPPAPEAGEAWIPGYWWWSPPLGRYVWVSGTWRHAPPDETWTPGAWVLDGAQYTWLPGYWAAPGAPSITVEIAPPALRVEVATAAPAMGFAWTPGFYDFRAGSYVWVAGSWVRPPSPDLVWVEPRYVGRPGHFRFQPGRWDFPPDRRGFAYRPDIDVRPGERVHWAPLPREVVVEHAHYNWASSHALAMGDVRGRGGGFTKPHPGQDRTRFGGAGRPEEHPGPQGHPGPAPQPQHGGPFAFGRDRGPMPGPGAGHGGGKRH